MMMKEGQESLNQPVDPIMYRVEILSVRDAEREMSRIGTHPEGIRIMAPKAVFRIVKIHSLAPWQANVLKQEMLSLGAEAATASGCINCSCMASDVLLMGTLAHFICLAEKLKRQSPTFQTLAEKILEVARSPSMLEKYEWHLPGQVLRPDLRSIIMGIVNVTPDSFSDGGKYFDAAAAVEHAMRMESDGADILDIGGESSRPGSEPVSADEEMRRVLPVIETLRGKTRLPVSIDTTKAVVAESAIKSGAAIVNDISALRHDPRMASLCAEKKVGVVLMHMKGEPKTMQISPVYEDVVEEVSDFFKERMCAAMDAGIDREAIVLDPGIGFGKALEHNLALMRSLGKLAAWHERPLLLGVSRKSFIGALTGAEIDERLPGTLAAVVACALRGASILRVHDVAVCRAALQIADALR
jgi:dihydropteroate synthase